MKLPKLDCFLFQNINCPLQNSFKIAEGWKENGPSFISFYHSSSLLFLQSSNLCVSLKETKHSHASQFPSCFHHGVTLEPLGNDYICQNLGIYCWSFPCIHIRWNCSLVILVIIMLIIKVIAQYFSIEKKFKKRNNKKEWVSTFQLCCCDCLPLCWIGLYSSTCKFRSTQFSGLSTQ